ncbi:MAG TPA: ABC transporter permease [Anaerolineaceae bacterium]|nr:ABC transporter permease [Anaerolineaceae bacterium]HPN52977.1 ABC transporter permease [Anaerolineaceae bacterium]
MKALIIAKKILIEAWREPQYSLLYLFFPAVMIWIFFYAYSNPSLSTMLIVLVDNQDQGALGAKFVQALEAETYDGKPVYTIQPSIDRSVSEQLIGERKAALLMIIPPDFSTRVQAARLSNTAPSALLNFVGDPGSDMYMFTQGFLVSSAASFAGPGVSSKAPSQTSLQFLPGTGALTDFQFGIPGVFAFGILFGAITSAMVVVRDDVTGVSRRLRLTSLTSFDMVLGVVLGHAAEAFIQLPLSLLVAFLLGLKVQGSVALIFLACLLLSLTSTGLGFLSACLAKNDGEAANVATGFMVPIVFLSGTVFPMPAAPVGKVAGQVISLYDIFPTTHASEIMRRVMFYGDGFSQLLYPFAMLTILSVLILAAGVWFYQRRRAIQ